MGAKTKMLTILTKRERDPLKERRKVERSQGERVSPNRISNRRKKFCTRRKERGRTKRKSKKSSIITTSTLRASGRRRLKIRNLILTRQRRKTPKREERKGTSFISEETRVPLSRGHEESSPSEQ